jgi:DNA-binding helix-hairpin-helix protein with protein kinase domain
MQTRALPALLDSAGHRLQLGRELGSGYEGSVFDLRDRSDLVVKLYHKPIEREKAAKIANMAKAANDRLLKLTAWPIEPIRAGSPSGPVVGFTMAKITGHKQAFNLYSPKLRLREFPNASWQFLIHSAANAARAFNMIHECGHVIGDVNHGNLFVGDRATVRLIDCDSYQISVNGSRWFCEVGTPTHQPPELQNLKTYKGVVRTPNHDNFGLAVIVFQMLFMARHPFSGRFLGAGDMPMERAISEYRFAFSGNASAVQMQPPPASLALTGVSRDVALLFERAFSRQGSQPNGRPQAREWATALQDLENHLKKCSVNPAHQFVDTLNKCPWCDIEVSSGVPLFHVTVVGSAQTGFAIAVFWTKVLAVPNPGPPPAFPNVQSQSVALSSEGQELQQAAWGAKIASGLLALFGISSRIHSLKKEISKKRADAREQSKTLKSNWDSYTSGKEFQDGLSNLQTLRSQYDQLPQKRLRALAELEANRQRSQLQAHLDRCRISHARIRGVGDARKATLQSYGIETAADIIDHRVLAVPGFGPVNLSNLKQWRDQQLRRFVYDPNKGVDPADRNKVEREILTEKIGLERKLSEGLSKLSITSNHILARRRNVLSQADKAALDIAQAEADLRGTIVIPAVVPKKWAFGVLGVGFLIAISIATHQTPAPRAPSPPISQPAPIAAVAPIAPARPQLPPHIEIDAKGQRQPQDGYDWSDAGHTNARWSPGKVSKPHPHVVASDTEGDWQPEDGYDWVDANKQSDKSVRWVPGTRSNRYPNILAGSLEGQWRPADGFTWVLNPPRPGDMRVRPIGVADNRIPTPVADSFQQGVTDRAAMEQWVAGLSGDFKQGVDWWAEHRSGGNPGSCSGAASASPGFFSGCEAARARFAPIDVKRKSDPEYRRGWNSNTGVAISPPPVTVSPPAAPGPPTPLIGQAPPIEPSATDDDPARRLNEQELRRLKGQ